MRISTALLRTPFSDREELLGAFRAAKGEIAGALLDPEAVLSRRHLEFSCFQAFKAFRGRRAFAATLDNEILVRVAGTRKVSEAISLAGFKRPDEVLLVVLEGDAHAMARKIGARVLADFPHASEQNAHKLAARFGIEKAALELYSLEGLILEKIALLNLEK